MLSGSLIMRDNTFVFGGNANGNMFRDAIYYVYPSDSCTYCYNVGESIRFTTIQNY